MDPVIFLNVEVVQQNMFHAGMCSRGHSEVFHMLQVAPEQDRKYHWSTVLRVSETIWARN